MSGSPHPDTAWLGHIKDILDTWLAGPDRTGPTSQVTGGAVREAELLFSRLHDNRPALMVANATGGLLAALWTLGVRPGSEVLISAIDWPGTLGVVRALGATPIIVPSDPDTLTMSPLDAGRLTTAATKAIVASHILGIPADIPAIRAAVGAIPIIEDCAQAAGSTLDQTLVGCLGDLAVFSFGPGKTIHTAEGGMILCRDRDAWNSLVKHAHPTRQLLDGIDPPSLLGIISRPHPLAAVLLAHRLATWNPAPGRRRFSHAVEALLLTDGVTPLGCDTRRNNAAASVPIRFDDTVNDVQREQLRSRPGGPLRIDVLHAVGETVTANAWLIPVSTHIRTGRTNQTPVARNLPNTPRPATSSARRYAPQHHSIGSA